MQLKILIFLSKLQTNLTPKRVAKLKTVVSHRQKYLTVVLENIHDPHNVSAILRSADAAGIDGVYLIYNSNKFPKIGRTSSASAKKWVRLFRYDSVFACYESLRKDKFRIYSTALNEQVKSKSLYEINLTKRTALVFGNEHEGVSEQAAKLSDANFIIPMYGMVQSLNVSVAAAISIYESLRQREVKGMYEKSAYTRAELKNKLKEYLNK